MIHNDIFQAHLEKVSPDIKMATEWSSQIIDRIDCILKEKNMTQRELAAKIGCNETQIVRWTRGFPNYTLATLAKLSVALGENLIKISDHEKIVSGYSPLQQQRTRQYLSEPDSPAYDSGKQ